MVEVLLGMNFTNLSVITLAAIGCSLELKLRRLRMTAADSIYTEHNLHSLPHRWRIRQVIRLLKQLCPDVSTYADVGCGDGFVTSQIARELQVGRCVGYD